MVLRIEVLRDPPKNLSPPIQIIFPVSTNSPMDVSLFLILFLEGSFVIIRFSQQHIVHLFFETVCLRTHTTMSCTDNNINKSCGHCFHVCSLCLVPTWFKFTQRGWIVVFGEVVTAVLNPWSFNHTQLLITLLCHSFFPLYVFKQLKLCIIYGNYKWASYFCFFDFLQNGLTLQCQYFDESGTYIVYQIFSYVVSFLLSLWLLYISYAVNILYYSVMGTEWKNFFPISCISLSRQA